MKGRFDFDKQQPNQFKRISLYRWPMIAIVINPTECIANGIKMKKKCTKYCLLNQWQQHQQKAKQKKKLQILMVDNNPKSHEMRGNSFNSVAYTCTCACNNN